MGLDLFGKPESGSSKPQVYGPQAPFLMQGFNTASAALTNAMNVPSYAQSGQPLYAKMTPGQKEALSGLFGQGTGMANNPLMGFGSVGAAGITPYMQNASANYAAAGADPMAYARSTAEGYAGNPYVGGMIDASLRDVSRAFGEEYMPALNNEATATGNSYSTRAGVAQAIGQRGAMDRMADISSTMRGGLYSQGLDAGLGQFNQNVTNRVLTNDAFRTGAALGGDLWNTGGSLSLAGGRAAVEAAAPFQGEQQALINEKMQREQAQRYLPFDVLDRYWNVAGWGGPGTASNTQGASAGPANYALAGASILAPWLLGSSGGTSGGWF